MENRINTADLESHLNELLARILAIHEQL